MKIAILSDTHTKVGKAKKAIDFLLDQGAEFFIHAGDIVEVEILEYLQNTQKRYVAVYGNNDVHLVTHHNRFNLVQEPHYFKLANTSFKLMHLPYYLTNDTEVVIFGHTHKFEVEYKAQTLYLNPGEVCARNKNLSECALLEVKEEQFVVRYFTRKPKKEFTLTQELTFARS